MDDRVGRVREVDWPPGPRAVCLATSANLRGAEGVGGGFRDRGVVLPSRQGLQLSAGRVPRFVRLRASNRIRMHRCGRPSVVSSQPCRSRGGSGRLPLLWARLGAPVGPWDGAAGGRGCVVPLSVAVRSARSEWRRRSSGTRHGRPRFASPWIPITTSAVSLAWGRPPSSISTKVASRKDSPAHPVCGPIGETAGMLTPTGQIGIPVGAITGAGRSTTSAIGNLPSALDRGSAARDSQGRDSVSSRSFRLVPCLSSAGACALSPCTSPVSPEPICSLFDRTAKCRDWRAAAPKFGTETSFAAPNPMAWKRG
jgi:hypothetical protein